MSEITKEELLAMIDVQGKAAQAMENIANSVRQMTEQNKDILISHKELVKTVTEHTDHCKKSICDVVDRNITTATEKCAENKALLTGIDKNIYWVKIIVSAATLIITLALVITRYTHWLGHLPQTP